MTHKAWKMGEEKLEAVFIAVPVISFSVGKNRFSYIAVYNVNIFNNRQ